MDSRSRWFRTGLLPPLVLAALATTGAAQGGEVATTTFAQLEGEFEKAYAAWRGPWLAARRAEQHETAARLEKEDPTASFLPRFDAAAARCKGSEDAVPFLTWVLVHSRYGKGDPTKALDELLTTHIASPQIERVPFIMALQATREGVDRAETLARQTRIAEQNPHPAVQANALYWRSFVVAETTASNEERERAIRDLRQALSLGNEAIQQKARSLLFELERLQIGMPAPDIEGDDLDGTAFKLSDYRGKVVMLDFWGDW